jgi:hypothetical protein
VATADRRRPFSSGGSWGRHLRCYCRRARGPCSLAAGGSCSGGKIAASVFLQVGEKGNRCNVGVFTG